MLTSYNGWPASPNWADIGGLEPLVYKGESFPPGVLAGFVHDVFLELVKDLDAIVEPVYAVGWHTADDWGASFRQNRNANNLSCHASATAIDYNATRHPNGKRGTFSTAQANAIRHLLKTKYRGLIRWGGDFTGTPDEMHFEIIGTKGQIKALALELAGAPAPTPDKSGTYTVAKGDTLTGIAARFGSSVPALVAANGLRNANTISVGQVLIIPGHVPTLPAPNPAPQPWLMLPPVRSRPKSFQAWYNAYPFKPALLPVIRPLANNFGPQSESALKKVQARYGLVADGVDGPLTKKLLWDLGWRG